jgi:hypothetical protein
MATPNTFKQQNVFAVFSAIFGVQAALGTPIPQADLTAQLPLARDGKPLPSRRVTRDETRDVTGKYLVGRRLTSRLALWTLTLPAINAKLAAGFLAWALNDAAAPTGAGPHTHLITRSASDRLKATSFVIGAKDSDEPAELYSDMVLNTLEIRGEVRQKLSLTAGFVGGANPTPLVGYTPPACTAPPVALYPQDCLLMVAGTDYTEGLRSLLFRFNNNVYSADDPFPWDAVDPVRLERGIEESQFTMSMYGTKSHPLYALALAEDVEAMSLRLGSTTEGTTITVPAAQLTLGDPPIAYAGEASRSALNLVADPFSADGCALPDSVTYVGAQAEPFLTVPA